MRRLRNTVLPGLVIAALLGVGYAVRPRVEGIDVHVTLAVRCPGRPARAPGCERPYPAFIRVVKPGHHEVIAGHRAPASGRFRFRLDPGQYVLLAARPPGATAPRARPVRVFVRTGRYSPGRVRYRLGAARRPGRHARRR